MLQSQNVADKTDFHANKYKGKITKVKFVINVKVPNSKIESWDVSEAKDGSVMAWVKDDGNEGYILTIAGKEKIFANTNSSFLFYQFLNLKEIEELELLDTSKVINMENMFALCENLTTLNLNKFNTSFVTNMARMFYYCSEILELDLSSFNTSEVKDMQRMFEYCKV